MTKKLFWAGRRMQQAGAAHMKLQKKGSGVRPAADQNNGRSDQKKELMNVEHRTSNFEHRIKEIYRF